MHDKRWGVSAIPNTPFYLGTYPGLKSETFNSEGITHIVLIIEMWSNSFIKPITIEGIQISYFYIEEQNISLISLNNMDFP